MLCGSSRASLKVPGWEPAWSSPAPPPPGCPPGRDQLVLTAPLAQPDLALQSFPWRLSRGNGLALPHHKERQYTIASALPKPCFFEDFYGPYAKANEKGPYFLTEYSTHQLFSQLTLLQQVMGAAWPASLEGRWPQDGGRGPAHSSPAGASQGGMLWCSNVCWRDTWRAVNGARCTGRGRVGTALQKLQNRSGSTQTTPTGDLLLRS